MLGINAVGRPNASRAQLDAGAGEFGELRGQCAGRPARSRWCKSTTAILHISPVDEGPRSNASVVGSRHISIDRLNLRGALTLARVVEVVAPSLLAPAELAVGAIGSRRFTAGLLWAPRAICSYAWQIARRGARLVEHLQWNRGGQRSSRALEDLGLRSAAGSAPRVCVNAGAMGAPAETSRRLRSRISPRSCLRRSSCAHRQSRGRRTPSRTS